MAGSHVPTHGGGHLVSLCYPNLLNYSLRTSPRDLTTVALVTVGWLSDEGLAGNTYPTYPRAPDIKDTAYKNPEPFGWPWDR